MATSKPIVPSISGGVKKTPKLSAGMQKWVEANRSKLKNPTQKQDAIFKQYDKLKKEGRLSKDTGMPSKNNAPKLKSKPNPTAKHKPTANTAATEKPISHKTTGTKKSSPRSDKAVEGGSKFKTISQAQYRKLLSNAKDDADYQRIRQRYRNRVR